LTSSDSVGELQRRRADLDRRRRIMIDGLAGLPGVSVPFEPTGAFFLLADVTGCFGRRLGGTVIGDAATFAQALLDSELVGVVPGDSFGAPGYVRVSYVVPAARLADAIDRLRRFTGAPNGQRDFSSTVSKIMAAKPDAVFYSGYYAEAAPFDQQLVNKGYTGYFVGPDGTKDPAFIQQAGNASSNAVFTCPCTDGSLIPVFAAAYEKVSNGTAPGTFSLEGYDAATVLLKGIDAGNTDRASLLNYVKNYNGDALSKHLQWNSNGELKTTTVYGYKVQNGKIVFLGPVS